MTVIESLCRQYTCLTSEDISVIEQTAVSLQLLANLEDADAFIDCPCADGNAIVVAEAKPHQVSSSYQKKVAGLIAKPEDEPAVARTMRLGVATKRMKALTQESLCVIQSVEPIIGVNSVIGVLIIEKRADDHSVTDRQHYYQQQGVVQFAQAFPYLRDVSDWLTEFINEALMMVGKDGIVVFRNSLAQNLYQELGHVEDVLAQFYESVRLIDVPSLAPGEFSCADVSVGKHFLTVKHIQLDMGDLAFAVMIRDITGIKEQEKELILRSIAIKEMHHRVKNNLQTIASLLRLQIRRSGSGDARTALQEGMSRILSIAATHELLAQNGVDQVNICEVIVNIKNNTVRYFSRPNLDAKVLIEGDDFEVDSDVATSIALVINELLQNSLMYAFNGRCGGNIRIIVEKGGLYSLIHMIDDGCGFDVNRVQENRLGLSIVRTLVKDKLRGDLNITSGKEGTAVKFSFKK